METKTNITTWVFFRIHRRAIPARRYRNFFSLLLFTVLLNITGRAQFPDYHLQLFDYDAGIRPGNILAAVKDHKGFLWIMYPRMIQRFDGKRTRIFRPEGNFESIYCDRLGRVWLSTPFKIYRFKDDYRGFEEIPMAIHDSLKRAGFVFNLPDGKTYMVGSRGFFVLDEKDQTFFPAFPDSPVKPPYSLRVFEYYNNTLFITKNRWVYRYDVRTSKVDSLPNQFINKVVAFNEDSAIVTTWKNRSYWYNFKAGTITPLKRPAGLRKESDAYFSIRSMVQVDKNRFFLACREGIFEYNNLEKVFRRPVFFLNGTRVIAEDYANYVHFDKDGNVWMATVDGMVRFHISKHDIGLIRIRNMSNATAVGVNNVRNMEEDDEGNLWLATANGFATWKKQLGQWEFYPPSQNDPTRLSHPSVRGIRWDGKYIVLGPTDTGIWLFDPKTKRFRRPIYDPGKKGEESRRYSEADFVDDIFKLQNGNMLIMGRDALYVLEKKDYLLRKIDLPAGRENTNFAQQGKDGVVWLATNTGLHCFDSTMNYLLNVDLPFRNKYISCAFMNRHNELLMGCEEGLFAAKYKNGKTEIRKFTNVFDNIFLNIIYQDFKDIIWACSESGIYRFDPISQKINVFDYSDNVQGYGFNINAWLRNKEGLLLLAGINGINYLNPENFSLANDSLNIYIQHIRIDNNDTLFYTLKQNPLLQYGQRSIDAEFTSPYFNNPDKVQYRYRLAGYDKDWKYIGNNNSVRLTSLAPGDYSLQVQASLNNVDWVDARNNFAFRIDSPFWSKGWFIALCLFTIGGLGYLFIRNRNQKLRRKEEELEAEQAINYFASSMYEQQSVESILWDVVKNCIGRLNFEDCVIYLVDEERNVLVQKAAYGPKSENNFEVMQAIEIPIGEGITGSVALSGKAELIPDTTKDKRYIIDDQRRHSEITVPIISDGKVIGIIDCEHSKKGFFTQKHLSILVTIASLCANKIVKARTEQEKTKAEQVLMATKQKMADVEMQALRAQMNPHFIFNCLNSINRYIVKSDQATASLYLTRFAKLIRLILDNSNSKNVLLSNELEALRLYIEMEMLRFDKKFSYSVSVDESINPDAVELPPLIMQPYVENAIWHGLLHKETGGRLSIDIRKNGDNILLCRIEDDGVGRDKAIELKSKTATTRKSLGMKLTEDRISLLNKHAELNASVDIIDLWDNNGVSRGTRVILRIPI